MLFSPMFSIFRQSKAPPLPSCIFPTSLLQKVTSTSAEWLKSSQIPFTKNDSKLYLLGTLPINIPTKSTLPFTSTIILKSHGYLLMNEIFNSEKRLSFLVNESKNDIDWLLSDYYPYYKSQPQLHSNSNLVDVNEYLQYQKIEMQGKNNDIHIELDVPDEFIELMSSGMLPKQDLIDGLGVVEAYSRLDCLGTVKYLAPANLIETRELQEPPRISKPGLLKEELGLYYESIGVSEDEIKSIITANQSTQSIAQKMLIAPLEMKNYQDVFINCYGDMSKGLKIRFLEKEAKTSLLQKRILDAISDKRNEVNVVFIDRDSWPSITSALWQSGYTQ